MATPPPPPEPTATITSIEGCEPPREGEYPMVHAVGSRGVTRIEKRDAYRGDHSVFWFDVYVGEHLVCSLNERFVATVNYHVPQEGEE